MIVSSKKDKYLGFTKNCLLSRRARWNSWQSKWKHRREEKQDQPAGWKSEPAQGKPDQTLIEKKGWVLGTFKHLQVVILLYASNFVPTRIKRTL